MKTTYHLKIAAIAFLPFFFAMSGCNQNSNKSDNQLDENLIRYEAEGNAFADGNPYSGMDVVFEGVFASINADHDYFKLADIELHEMSKNQVLETLRYDGKYKNGSKYNTQVAHLWSLKDGKITAFQQYLDTKKVADAA